MLSNSSKVMVDVDGGNNLMYLPLDKLTQQAAASAGSPESVRSIADAVMRELNNRAGSGRVRDTR